MKKICLSKICRMEKMILRPTVFFLILGHFCGAYEKEVFHIKKKSNNEQRRK